MEEMTMAATTGPQKPQKAMQNLLHPKPGVPFHATITPAIAAALLVKRTTVAAWSPTTSARLLRALFTKERMKDEARKTHANALPTTKYLISFLYVIPAGLIDMDEWVSFAKTIARAATNVKTVVVDRPMRTQRTDRADWLGGATRAILTRVNA
ncbi:hypothetical protein HPP92_013223 [Vanilla planifolia]|uniref:Uncharacterized protein n=1 Tax=Vanilla planifolia TaxID=51239 RepID=A0A835QTN6_VANPL|nr:hypothetical protein HPP92_013223 [Vanilla planifolia]